MKRGLQVVLFILSFIPLYFAAQGIIGGAASFNAEEPVLNGLENQFRYLSAFYLILTFLIWYMLSNIEQHTNLMRIAVLAIFLGGLARLYSYMTMGAPPLSMFGGMVLELGSPILLLWHAKVVKLAD